MLPDVLLRLVGEQAAYQKIHLTNWIWSFVPLVEGSMVPMVLERSDLGGNEARSTCIAFDAFFDRGRLF